MPEDRIHYSHALSDSWKRQMLLNIVKTRYMDLPIFLDVGQLVSGYSMETTVNAGGTLSSNGSEIGTLGGSARYTDRPTITYLPLTGDRFLEAYLTPIKASNVFAMIQAGYAADFILELCLDSFNGLHNHSAALASTRPPDPEFFEVTSLMRAIQNAGAIGMRVKAETGEEPASVFFFRKERVDPAILEKARRVRQLLRIPPDQDTFILVSSPVTGGDGELAVGTRSLWQIIGAMAMGIQIPQAHRDRGLVPPMTETLDDTHALLRVHSGAKQPPDAFVAVQYEDAWFWIENNDWTSKRTFTSTLFLFSLSDTGIKEKLPMITIPAQ